MAITLNLLEEQARLRFADTPSAVDASGRIDFVGDLAAFQSFVMGQDAARGQVWLVIDDPVSCGTALDVARGMRGEAAPLVLCAAKELDASQTGKLVESGRALVDQSGKSSDELLLAALRLSQDMLAWESSLDSLLLAGRPLDEILDLSARALLCPLVVSGVGLRILGYSKSMLPEEESIVRALEQGYFDEEHVASFRMRRMPEQWEASRGLTLLDDETEHRRYPMFFRVFRVHSNYYMHLNVHVSKREVTPGLRDQIAVLEGAIERYIKLNPPAEEVFGGGFPALMANVARGAVPVSKRVRGEFAAVGVSDETPYRLLLVDYGFKGSERQLARQSAFELIDRVPSDFVAVINSCAAILQPNPAGEHLFPDEVMQHAQKLSGRVAVSDIMHGIDCLHDAYDQVDAVRAVLASRPGAFGGAATFTQAFADCFIVGYTRTQVLVDYALTASIPARIQARDAERGDDDLAILRTYLECGRRATEASDKLFMNRNTLLYRIKRIERDYEVSLDNPDTCLRMLLELRMLD